MLGRPRLFPSRPEVLLDGLPNGCLSRTSSAELASARDSEAAIRGRLEARSERLGVEKASGSGGEDRN
jgi:hypothetical protein